MSPQKSRHLIEYHPHCRVFLICVKTVLAACDRDKLVFNSVFLKRRGHPQRLFVRHIAVLVAVEQ